MDEVNEPVKAARTATTGTTQCSAFRKHRTALVVSALAGAVVAFGVLKFLTGDTGDEPPIRVRGGSIELHLLSSREEWKDTGTHWKMKGDPSRANNDYQVVVTYKSGADCPNNGSARGEPLEIKYFVDQTTTKSVNLRIVGNHTQVHSDAALVILPNTDNQVLSYSPGTGYIQSISVGGTPVCTFTEQGQLIDLVILDF